MSSSSDRARLEQRRRTDGERTHRAILEAAVRVASVEGINGMTIGRLADELDVSKSGLYAHFGSKEQLQFETIDAAFEIFEAEVMQPALAAPDGLPRLDAFIEAFFSYVERDVFPGGCFFASLLAEEDARTGPIHDRVVALERDTVGWIAETIAVARGSGEIARDTDPEQLAYELYAFMELANFHFVLLRDPAVLARGRRAIERALDAVRVTRPGAARARTASSTTGSRRRRSRRTTPR